MYKSPDASMIEEGCMLINKGLKLGVHALEELDDPNADDNSLGIGCYMLAQSIELLIKGLCYTFNETPPPHHIIKHSAKLLLNVYESKVPEMYCIDTGLNEICENKFAYIIQTWQKDGRYEFLQANREYIEKAELIYADLKRFIYNYQLHVTNE